MGRQTEKQNTERERERERETERDRDRDRDRDREKSDTNRPFCPTLQHDIIDLVSTADGLGQATSALQKLHHLLPLHFLQQASISSV